MNTKITNGLYYYLFPLLALAIPVHDKLVPPVIAVIGLVWLLEMNFKEKAQRIMTSRKNKIILSFGIIYLLYLLGTLYSEVLYGQEGALFDLEVKLTLLLFPLFMSTIDFSKLKNGFAESVLDAYVAGAFINLLILSAHSAYRFFSLGESTAVFYYTGLSYFAHPSYLAMFYAFASGILVVRLLTNPGTTKFYRYFTIFLIFSFQLFIVLLSSKAGILGMAAVYIVITVYLLVKRVGTVKILFLVPVFFLFTFIITLFGFPRSYGRFYALKSSVENAGGIKGDTKESSAERMLVWKAALRTIKKHPLFGAGTGDVKKELISTYQESGVVVAMEEHLNAHNQYIQTAVALGIMGLLVLLAMLYFPAVYAYRHNNLLYLIFLSLVSFHFLFESMLERQAGVVFFAFFNSFLFLFTDDKNTI